MRRGTIVTVAMPGDDGKPRPAVVIQSERLAATDSLLVCPLTSTQRDAPLYRLAVAPDAENGLRQASDIMVDKITAVRRAQSARRSDLWELRTFLRSTAYWRSRSGSPTGPGRTARERRSCREKAVQGWRVLQAPSPRLRPGSPA